LSCAAAASRIRNPVWTPFNVGLNGRKIAAISTGELRGKSKIDATGLVVAPGFVDLHQHSYTPEAYRYKAMDGVTTALVDAGRVIDKSAFQNPVTSIRRFFDMSSSKAPSLFATAGWWKASRVDRSRGDKESVHAN
jgi:adenine deaminase